MLQNSVSYDPELININCHAISMPETCKNTMSPGHNFTILTLNIRSLEKNFNCFYTTLCRFTIKIEVIVLTECWLNETSIIPNIPGYSAHNTKAMRNQNSGVVIYVENSHSASVYDHSTFNSDCLLVKINNLVSVLGIYRSPCTRSVDDFLELLDNLLSKIRDQANIVVCGDININITPALNQTSCADYLCLLAEHALTGYYITY